jgi:Icc-related predicted phosphoesterase
MSLEKASSWALFFATDLHGSERCFHKFVNAAAFYDAQILILGGDLIGKTLVPLRRRPGGHLEANHEGKSLVFSTEKEASDFEARCADRGIYTARLEDEDRPTAVEWEQLLFAAARQRLERWLDYAVDRLSSSGVRLLAIPGNDDPPFVDEVLMDRGPLLSVDRRLVTVDGAVQVVGLGWATPTPWQTHREFSDQEIGSELERLLTDRQHDLPLILNVHIPPYGSGLDTCPVLDAELRPVVGTGGPLLAPVGSQSVHRLILEQKPILGLFGHVHEARSCTRIGRTLCANPGSEAAQGNLQGFLASIGRGKVRQWLLTEG